MKNFLYSQIIEDLQTKIELMEKGSKIASERELSETYKVSRSTIRKALQALINSGFLYQIRGKGTFVRESKKENLSNYFSFKRQIEKLGKKPRSLIEKYTIRNAHDKEKEIFQNYEDFDVIVIDWLRFADDNPLLYEITIIPYDRFKNISKEILEKKALYDIFEQDYDLKIYDLTEKVSVSKLKSTTAKLLNQDYDAPCLEIRRFAYDIEDKLIEYTVSYARADVFNYEISYKPNY